MLSNPKTKWYAGHMGPNRWVVFPYSSIVTEGKFGKYFYSVIGPLKTQMEAEGVVRKMDGVLVVIKSVRELETLPGRNPRPLWHETEADKLHHRGRTEQEKHYDKGWLGAHEESARESRKLGISTGAGWHRTEELRSQQRESDSIRLGRQDLESFYRGSKMAHRESRIESERLGENPGQPYSRASWWFVKNRSGETKVIQKEERPIGKVVVGPFNTRKFAEKYAWARLEVKDNPCSGEGRRNPVVQGTKIYDKIQAIEAQKGGDSLWPGENFRHDFKGGGEIWGLENGDLLIKKKKKKLWKNFDY